MKSPVLIGEVLASSGPRKNWDANSRPRDPELGEDAAGLIHSPNGQAWLWVADGTSDMAQVAGFSSRRLAQDLGSWFTANLLQQNMEKSESLMDPVSLLRQTAVEVNSAWTKEIEAHPAKKENLLAQLQTLAQPRESPETQNLFFEFSSTFALAGLTANGRMKGAGVGDSFLAVEKDGQLQFFALGKGNITIRIRNNESKIRVDTFYPEPEPFESEATDLVMLASDGARDTFKKLHGSLASGFRFTRNTYSEFKKHLAGVPSKTQDDKTLVYLGRCHED